MRGLLIAALKTSLALADSESPEPLDVRRAVDAMARFVAPGYRQGAEALAEPKPRRRNAE